MTYCVGLDLKDGPSSSCRTREPMPASTMSRPSAKMHVFEVPGERVQSALLTARQFGAQPGGGSICSRRAIESDGPPPRTLYNRAQHVPRRPAGRRGDPPCPITLSTGPALQAQKRVVRHLDPCSAAQLKRPLDAALPGLFPAGNFHRGGRPTRPFPADRRAQIRQADFSIRAASYDTELYDGVKLVLVSMDFDPAQQSHRRHADRSPGLAGRDAAQGRACADGSPRDDEYFPHDPGVLGRPPLRDAYRTIFRGPDWTGVTAA